MGGVGGFLAALAVVEVKPAFLLYVLQHGVAHGLLTEVNEQATGKCLAP